MRRALREQRLREQLAVTAVAWGRSVFVTGAYGFVGGWLTRGAARARRARQRAAPRPRAGCVLELERLERECEVIDGDVVDAALLERALTAGASRRHSTSPRRRPSAPATPRRSRRSSRTCAAPGTCSRRCAATASSGRSSRHPSTPTARPSGCRSPRTRRCGRRTPTRRRRPRPTSSPARTGRAYGLPVGDDALRQRLRRRRPEPLAARPVGGRGAARRAATRDPLRRLARARLPARRRRASTPTSRSPTRSTAARRAGEAFNAGGGEPHRVLDVVAQLVRAVGHAACARTCAARGTPAGEIDRQWLDSVEAARADRLGAAGRARATACARTLEWYRAHPARLAA